MVNLLAAISLVKTTFPDYPPKSAIDYNGNFVFLLDRSDPFEENMDPYCAVNKTTGEVLDFSIFEDGNADLILKQFKTNPVWLS